MNAHVAAARCFLVEWYQRGPAAMSADDAASHLTRAAAADAVHPPTVVVTAMTMPDDETFLCVFTAASAEAIAQTCRNAGWPADRISADIDVWPRQNPQTMTA